MSWRLQGLEPFTAQLARGSSVPLSAGFEAGLEIHTSPEKILVIITIIFKKSVCLFRKRNDIQKEK